MKQKIFAAFVSILAAALLAVSGCGKGGGKTVDVGLEENPSTGYTWSYTAEPAGVLTQTETRYIQPNTGAAGAPGKRVWSFAPEQNGTVTLTFLYSQSWEGGSQGETRVYRFQVAGGVPTLLSEETIPAPSYVEQLMRLDNVFLEDGIIIAEAVYLKSEDRSETVDGATLYYEELTEIDGRTHTLIVSPDAYVDFSEDLGPETMEIRPDELPGRFAELDQSWGVRGLNYIAVIADDTITSLTFYYTE